MYAAFLRRKKGEYMKILVFSDSHGRLSNIVPVCRQQDFDAVIFLGDGLSDIQTLEQMQKGVPVYAVRGNCDFFAGDAPDILMPVFSGKKIFITHGHLHYVKSGTDSLKSAARRAGADAVLYGHTHIPFYEDDGGFITANPGSAMRGCYAVMTVGENIRFELKQI